MMINNDEVVLALFQKELTEQRYCMVYGRGYSRASGESGANGDEWVRVKERDARNGPLIAITDESGEWGYYATDHDLPTRISGVAAGAALCGSALGD